MRRSIVLVLIAALALAAGAPGAATAHGEGATAAQKGKAKKKAKAKKRAASCKRAKAKQRTRGKARKATALATQKGKARKKAKAKRKAASCKQAKPKKRPKAKQPKGGLSDGTYEDAANDVAIAIRDGATQVTVKVDLTSPALFTLTLAGALGPDGSAGGSARGFAGVPVAWELQISAGGASYRLQYQLGDAEPEVITGKLR